MDETHIMMVGASRSGKTSIIAALKNVNLREGNVFLNHSITIFENRELNSKNSEDLAPTYTDMKNLSKAVGRSFLTTLYGTQGIADYHLGLDFNKNDEKGNAIKKMNFVFHDIPGEAYRMYDGEKIANLEKIAQECAVMIIAVDYPALKLAEYFEEEDDETMYLNTFMCDEALTRLLPKLGQKREKNAPKLVVIVPLKCEAYMNDEESIQEMYDCIKKRFSNRLQSIGTSANVKNVKILTMPIQTIGNVVASRDYDDDPQLCVFDNKKYPIEYESVNGVKVYKHIKTQVKKGAAKKDVYLSEDVRLMDLDGEDHYVSRCSGTGNEVTLHCGETYTLGAGDRIISASEFHDIPYSIRKNYPIPYIWYKADSEKTFSPHNEDQLLMELMKFSLQEIAFFSKCNMRQVLDPQYFTIWRIAKIILSFVLLGGFAILTLPYLLIKKDNAALIAEMANVVKKMHDDGEFKEEYEVLYNTLDNEGDLEL